MYRDNTNAHQPMNKTNQITPFIRPTHKMLQECFKNASRILQTRLQTQNICRRHGMLQECFIKGFKNASRRELCMRVFVEIF